MNTATEVILTDEDFVVVDCTNTDDTHGLYTSVARVSTPESWQPKAIRANTKRLDAHNKGIKAALVPSSSFRVKLAPEFLAACAKMDAVPTEAAASYSETAHLEGFGKQFTLAAVTAACEREAVRGLYPRIEVPRFKRIRKQLRELGVET